MDRPPWHPSGWRWAGWRWGNWEKWREFDRAGFAAEWRHDLRVAAAFYSVLPLGPRVEFAGEDLGRALRAGPLIGLGIGLAGGIGYALAIGLGLGPAIAGLLAIALTATITGALHEDGLADFADGLGGHDPETRLAIMRDSRLGAYGGLALIFSVALRASALFVIARPGDALAALAAAAALSRGLLPLVSLWLAPARAQGMGAMLGAPRRDVALTAAGIGAAIAIILLGFAGLLAILLGAIAVLGVAALARRRLGGYTGDVLGAAEQAAEIVILLVAAAAS